MASGTNNELYHKGTQFRITIYDKKEEEILAIYDPFHDNLPFALTALDIDLSYFQVGAYSFNINDTKDRVVADLGIDNETVVLIEGGKTEDLLVPFITGFTETKSVSSTKNNLVWNFSGLGKQVIWNYSQIEFQKIAPPHQIGEITPAFSFQMRIDNIIKQVFNSDSVFSIIDEKTLRERGNFDLSELTGNVNEVTGSIDFKGSAALLFDTLSNSAGAIMMTDNYNRPQFVYPFSRNTGLIIKEDVKAERASDDPDRVCYMYGTFTKTESTSTDDGFFNALIIDYQPEEVSTSNEGSGIDFFSLDNKDLCFQFLPQSTTLSNLAFMLAKKGSGKSNIESAFDINAVQGFIVTDSGDDEPSAGVVAKFEIPYDSISSVPSIISGFTITKIAPNFDPQRKHWCIIGSTGIEPENTVLVYTDGDLTTPTDDSKPVLRRVGIKTPNTPKPNIQLKAGFHKFFQITNTGPVPKHTFYTSSANEIYFQDSLSQSLYTPDRPKMARISAPFIRDHITAQKYAAAIIEYSAKKKIIFDQMEVQIPNKPIFPLQTGYIIYTPFGHSKASPLVFEVNGARYSWDAASRPLGIDTCSLQVTAFIDHFLLNKIHKDDCVECLC